MVEYLIISGADPYAQDRSGETPLHSVTRSCKLPAEGTFISEEDRKLARAETFDVLLLRRADRNIRNVQGANPLHLAAWNGDLVAINKLAVTTTIDERTTKGATALALAVLNGHACCAENLIKFGADAEMKLPSGNRISDFIRSSDDPNMRALSP